MIYLAHFLDLDEPYPFVCVAPLAPDTKRFPQRIRRITAELKDQTGATALDRITLEDGKTVIWSVT